MTEAPEVTTVRISGTSDAVAALAEAISRLDGYSVVSRSGAYLNRREQGERVYLAVCRDNPPDGAGANGITTPEPESAQGGGSNA